MKKPTDIPLPTHTIAKLTVELEVKSKQLMEIKSLMLNAATEITALRQWNNEMQMRLETFDRCWDLFTATKRADQRGFQEDVVAKIHRHVNGQMVSKGPSAEVQP